MKPKKVKQLVKKINTVCDFSHSCQSPIPTETTMGTDPTNTMITTITTVNTHAGR
jgi:hypothetical protein